MKYGIQTDVIERAAVARAGILYAAPRRARTSEIELVRVVGWRKYGASYVDPVIS